MKYGSKDDWLLKTKINWLFKIIVDIQKKLKCKILKQLPE